MSVYISVELQRQVREAFADRCAYCQTAEDLQVAIFEIEHIVPRSAGGATVFDNICLACPTCNRCKSDRTTYLDSQTGIDVPLFHPQQESWHDHFEWSENATEIVPLTATGLATVIALRMNRP